MSAFTREKTIEHAVDILRRAGWSQIEVEDRTRTIFIVVGTDGSTEQYIEEPMSRLSRAAYALGGPELYAQVEEYDIEPVPFPGPSRVGQLVHGAREMEDGIPPLGGGLGAVNAALLGMDWDQRPGGWSWANIELEDKMKVKEALEEQFVGAQARWGKALGRVKKTPVQAEGSPRSSYQPLRVLVAEKKLIRRDDGYYITYRSGHVIELVHTELGLINVFRMVKSKGFFKSPWVARIVEAAGIL